MPDSFIARLNAFIDEEVKRRIAEKDSVTVKQYFTVSDNYNNNPDIAGVIKRTVSNTPQQDSLTVKDHAFSCDDLNVKEIAIVKQSFTPNDKPDFITHFNAGQSSNSDTPDSVTVKDHKVVNAGLKIKDTGVESSDHPHRRSKIRKMQSSISNKSESKAASDIGELELEAEILNNELLLGIDNPLEDEAQENDAIIEKINENSETPENNKPVNADLFYWVYSSFTERINNRLIFSEADISGYINKFGSSGVKVLEIFKCLVKHLMLLSNRNEINRSSFISLSNIFCMLVSTKEFRSLPREFPYHSKIAGLQKKIQSFAQDTNSEEPVRLHLPAEQRAAFFAILCEMGDRVKDVKLSEIGFRK